MRVPCPTDELVEVRVLLERDERADPVARELRRGGHDLVDDLGLLLPREPAEEGARAHAHEPAADVVLEDDDDDQDDRRQERVSRLRRVMNSAHFDDDVDEEDDAEARCPSASRACREGRAARGRRRT